MNAADRYREKLQRPEWQIRRLRVLELSNFTCQSCGVSGVPLEVHHKAYRRGAEPWQYADDELQSLCVRCHNRATEQQAEMKICVLYPDVQDCREALRGIVATTARAHSLPHKARPIEKPRFDADRAWRWIKGLPDANVHRPMMKFAAWLWSTGTRDMDLIFCILEDRLKRNPDAPYAYYAPGGSARDCKAAAYHIQFAERENAAFKEADRRFIVGAYDDGGDN